MTDYEAKLRKWHENYQKSLQADFSWLSIIALDWLTEGENLIGSSKMSVVTLPEARVPEHLGILRLEQNEMRFLAHQPFTMRYQDHLVSEIIFDLSDNANSDHFIFGDFAFSVLRRDGQYGLRVFDKESETRQNFQGCKWFPIDSKYCVEAEFIPYTQPRPVTVTNILGGTYQSLIPGEAQFVLDSKPYKLLPTQDKQGLFFVFKDLTSQHLTYPAGRFLNADLPINGKLNLDFNKAYNPPCAFTPYATCPLPLKENPLDIQILAGEKYSS